MKVSTSLLVLFLIALTACSTVKLQPADFAWPLETVLTTDQNGFVTIERYSTEFNASELFKIEFSDSVNYSNRELRVIRGHEGYYYMTSAGFNNVYLFTIEESALVLAKKIGITNTGLTQPAFNQRKPNIELIDGENSYFIDSNGLKRN